QMSDRARAADRTRAGPRVGRCAHGFSLTELMITLAIIATLASIALPSYRNYVIRSHRGDATQALLRIAAQQEKYYIQNNSYASTLDAGGLDMDTKSENGWYDLSVTAGDVNGFTAGTLGETRAAPRRDTTH